MTPLTFVTNEHGSREAWRDGYNIAREGQGDSIAYVEWLLTLAKLGIRNGTVAHIGGGFCTMARIMGPRFVHDIYEIEREFKQFIPEGAAFIEGDWRDTLIGTYDLILYDLGGIVPEILKNYLNPNGLILPKGE